MTDGLAPKRRPLEPRVIRLSEAEQLAKQIRLTLACLQRRRGYIGYFAAQEAVARCVAAMRERKRR